MLDDFVDLWSAKERGRDGLVPGSFAEAQNRRRLRQASAARALCIVAVVELSALLFVAPSLSATVLGLLWALFAVTVAAAVVLAVRSLSALARVEREAAGQVPPPDGPPPG